ncbi:hypothetical protein Tco_1439496 [Tanacetum coccineum]
MAEPNEYIFVIRKNFLSNDNEGRMVEKSFLEIQRTFLVKIRNNTFNGIIGENAFKHIDNFIKVVGSLKINGLSQDQFRLSVFPVSLAGAASEWFKKDCIGSVTTWEDLVEKFVQKFYQLSDNNEEMETDEDDGPNNIADIFKIEGNLFDFETPLCKAFNEFNHLLKIDTNLFTFDIKGIMTYEEYELNNNMTGDLEEPWSDNRVTTTFGTNERNENALALVEDEQEDPRVRISNVFLTNVAKLESSIDDHDPDQLTGKIMVPIIRNGNLQDHRRDEDDVGYTYGVGKPTVKSYIVYLVDVAMKDGWTEGCRKVIGLDGCFFISFFERDNHSERDPNTWSRAFFQMDKSCEAFKNVICESYHAVIVNQRGELTDIIDTHLLENNLEKLKEYFLVVEVYPRLLVLYWDTFAIHGVAVMQIDWKDHDEGVSAYL